MAKRMLAAVMPLLILLIWWLVSSLSGNYVVPGIVPVFERLLDFNTAAEYSDLPPLSVSCLVSLIRTLLGFACAVLVAIPLGLLLGRSKCLRLIFSPTLDFFYVISPLAWLPLLITFVGVDSVAALLYGRGFAWQHPVADNILPAMVLIIALAAFFPVLYTAERAARGVREDLVEMGRQLGASRLLIMRRIILPHCLPEIIGGMRIGLGRAWMVIIAAEMYPGTRSGLGYTIWVSHSTLVYEDTFAAIILIGALGLLMNKGLGYLEHKAGHWEARRS